MRIVWMDGRQRNESVNCRMLGGGACLRSKTSNLVAFPFPCVNYL